MHSVQGFARPHRLARGHKCAKGTPRRVVLAAAAGFALPFLPRFAGAGTDPATALPASEETSSVPADSPAGAPSASAPATPDAG